MSDLLSHIYMRVISPSNEWVRTTDVEMSLFKSCKEPNGKWNVFLFIFKVSSIKTSRKTGHASEEMTVLKLLHLRTLKRGDSRWWSEGREGRLAFIHASRGAGGWEVGLSGRLRRIAVDQSRETSPTKAKHSWQNSDSWFLWEESISVYSMCLYTNMCVSVYVCLWMAYAVSHNTNKPYNY